MTTRERQIEAAAKAMQREWEMDGMPANHEPAAFDELSPEDQKWWREYVARALAAADGVSPPQPDALANEAMTALMALVAECRPDEGDFMCAAPPQRIYEMANEVAQRCHRAASGPLPPPPREDDPYDGQGPDEFYDAANARDAIRASRCENCGKTMAEHDALARCWPERAELFAAPVECGDAAELIDQALNALPQEKDKVTNADGYEYGFLEGIQAALSHVERWMNVSAPDRPPRACAFLMSVESASGPPPERGPRDEGWAEARRLSNEVIPKLAQQGMNAVAEALSERDRLGDAAEQLAEALRDSIFALDEAGLHDAATRARAVLASYRAALAAFSAPRTPEGDD